MADDVTAPRTIGNHRSTTIGTVNLDVVEGAVTGKVVKQNAYTACTTDVQVDERVAGLARCTLDVIDPLVHVAEPAELVAIPPPQHRGTIHEVIEVVRPDVVPLAVVHVVGNGARDVEHVPTRVTGLHSVVRQLHVFKQAGVHG